LAAPTNESQEKRGKGEDWTKIWWVLKKERFTRAMFNGQTFDLPIAPLEIGPAGPVRLEPIGNYKEPVNTKQEWSICLSTTTS
jgi:hypothetical protein